MTWLGLTFYQDPDAVYDLPPEQRAKVMGLGMAMRDMDGDFALPMPLTLRQLDGWAKARGLWRPAKGAGHG